MKLTEKIIWSCVMTIALIFSIGGSYLIGTNHKHLLDETIQQNINQHLTLSYALESKLLQDVTNDAMQFKSDQQSIYQKAMNYIQQLFSFTKQQGMSYALHDHKQQLLTSTMESSFLKQYDFFLDKYQIRKIQHRYYMLITSQITPSYQTTLLLTNAYDITSVYTQRTQQYNNFLFVDALSLLLACILIRIISKRMLQPLNKLNMISQHIAQGNYNERTAMQGNDEFSELSKSFDEMAQANQNTIEQLKANAEAKELFMGSFSHEIKTPMTAVIGFADMLRSYECDEETRKKALNFIYQESTRLEDLAQQMMCMLSLNKQAVHMQDVSTKKLEEQLAFYYTTQSYDVHFHIDHTRIFANDALLYTLLKNLIDNAIKASTTLPVHVLGKQKDASAYMFIIEDKGIGMSEEQRKKACEPFYMVEGSRKGGTGLGLTICKKICELHNTALAIDSLPQKGTRVSIVLEVYHDAT